MPDSLDGVKTAQTFRMGRMDLNVSPLNKSSVIRLTSAKNFLRSDLVYPSPLNQVSIAAQSVYIITKSILFAGSPE